MTTANIRDFVLARWYYFAAFTALLCLLYIPHLLYFTKHNLDKTFLLTSFIYLIPLCGCSLAVKNRHLFGILVLIFAVISMTETVMVLLFGSFISSGNIEAILMTNTTEATGFIKNSLYTLWYIIPMLLIAMGTCYLHNKQKYNLKFSLCCAAASLIISIGFVVYKQYIHYNNENTLLIFFRGRILNRPPYNMFFQTRNLIHNRTLRKYIKDGDSMLFGAMRTDSIEQNEIYVLAIGESMTYDNLSLTGYHRITTPNLDTISNLVLYENYYAGAYLTHYSVPQIITRATAHTYDVSYKEKGLTSVFHEAGFHSVVIANQDNTLGDKYCKYLNRGADEVIVTKSDKEITTIFDSISTKHKKLFCIMHFWGCHGFYDNYEPEFDVFRPNINSDPEVKSDSLYYNAYDNTILYQDYLLSTIINQINKLNAISTFVFLPDHGESVTENGGLHAGNCIPERKEYHVPLIIWYSNEYKNKFQQKIENLYKHSKEPINTDNIFYSICDEAEIQIKPEYQLSNYSIFSDSIQPHKRYVIVPDGVTVVEVK